MGTFVVLLVILFLAPFLFSLFLGRWQYLVLTAAGGVVLTILALKSSSAGNGVGAPFGLALVMVSAAGLTIGLITQAVRLWLTSRTRKTAIAASPPSHLAAPHAAASHLETPSLTLGDSPLIDRRHLAGKPGSGPVGW